MNWFGNIYFIILIKSLLILVISVENQMIVYPSVKYVEEKDKDKKGVIKVEFDLVNKSGKGIQILSINPHCACTDYSISSGFVEPNSSEKLVLSVSWDQLKNLREVYAVIKTDSKDRFLKASIKIKSE
jgi:hypothetical protein